MVEDISPFEDLTENELRVLTSLANWNYGYSKPSPFKIAYKLKLHEVSVCKILRLLKEKGFINKSIGGAWFIKEYFKNQLRYNGGVENDKRGGYSGGGEDRRISCENESEKETTDSRGATTTGGGANALSTSEKESETESET